MSWSTPRTWSPNRFLSAGDLNTYLRDDPSWIRDRKPTVRLRISDDILEVPPDSWFTIPWDLMNFDSDFMHDPRSNLTRVAINTPGIYLLGGATRTNNASGGGLIRAMKNGQVMLGGSLSDTGAPRMTFMALAQFREGDTVQMEVKHHGGNSKSISGASFDENGNRTFSETQFWAIWQRGVNYT